MLTMTFFTFNGISQVQIGSDIDGEAAGDFSGWALSMPDAFTIAIGARYNDGGGTNSGHVRIYKWNGSNWIQKGQDIDGEAVDDLSSTSVSMPDSNTVAIGAYLNDGNGTDAGHVRIYEWNGTLWVQKGLDIEGETTGDQSGSSVSMPDSNTVVIAASANDGNGISSGHVRIFEWNGSAWVQKGLDIDGEAGGDLSGKVSMPDANTVAIGAWMNYGAGTAAGHVRIFSWNGTAWIQKGLDIDGEAAGDGSGVALSMPDSNTIAIGAKYNNGNGNASGHVRVFIWNGSSWIQKGMDIDAESADNWAGSSVSMADSNTVAFSAPINDGGGTNAGHVRVYYWDGTTWVQGGLDIDGELPGDFSGECISMPAPSTIAIGSTSNDGNGIDAGHVRIYKLQGVQGLVYNDLNQNCIQEEIGVVEGVLGVIQPGNIVVETDVLGIWKVDSLLAGSYTITFDTTGSWLSSCPNPLNFTVANTVGLTSVPAFGMYNTNPCSEPNISVFMPFIRPGFSDQKIYVEACNDITATGSINNASVILSIDDSLILNSASISYTNIGNNSFSFNIGTLDPGECIDFILSTTLNSSVILGRTVCMEVELFPVDSCSLDSIPANVPLDFTPCSLPWDKSSLEVVGQCINDTIVFTITNTGAPGDGDMDCFSPVRLYIDGVYILLDSIQLNGGDSFTYSFAGDGLTWHLEVDQHPLHPGNSNPNTTVELCGNQSNWTPDLVNMFPHDDFDPINDVYCGIVTGSYDPNDKKGLPTGVGPDHLVAPEGKIDYKIRFQNTGTDTAFTVVIRDTLDIDFDIFSVVSGVSSHPCTFEIYGPRVLQWTFNNILLPDSTTNEPESHGFVTFTVNQVHDLPDGTEINNTADIYFDYNPPIITNTTSHIIGSEIQVASWTEEYEINNTSCDSLVYNGDYYNQSGTFYQVIEGVTTDTLVTLNLTINKSNLGTDIDTICDSYTWIDGVTYTSSNNTATHSLTNTTGCDSLVTLGLTIKNSTAATDVFSVCNSYTWIDGVTYISSNNEAMHILTNSVGCDSIIHLDLVINTVSDLTTSLSGITITANNSNAGYVWLDCDSNYITKPGETAQTFTPSQNGSYAVQLTENGCIDTTSCVSVTNIGILENTWTEYFVLFPNPTHGELTITFENEQQKLNVSVYSVSGELLQKNTIKNTTEVKLDLKGDSGTYLLKLESNGQEATIRVVKE